MTPDRRHSRAKKKTVATPVSTMAHHCQLPATPYWRTCCVTQFGVSLLNVVATIDSPASHHGTERPEAKNSDVLLPARLPKNSAGTKQIRIVPSTISQSRATSVMCGSCYATNAAATRIIQGPDASSCPGADRPVPDVHAARRRAGAVHSGAAACCRADCGWDRAPADGRSLHVEPGRTGRDTGAQGEPEEGHARGRRRCR